jgi:DNA (cytosine-5)-methyltransferase 1
MNFVSLFTGIGGLDLGLERAGMNCVAQVEIDDFCQKVLRKHWPNVPKYKDVRHVGKHNLPSADLICGGFPCQPHSLAGKRRGAADDRNLWPEYLRIIDELKPAWVLGENVPGIITTILDQVLSDLERLEYTCQTFIIPACGFNAPHKRDRVFIVAHSNFAEWRPLNSEGQHNQGRDDANRLQEREKVSGGFITSSEAWFMAHSEGDGLQKWERENGQPLRAGESQSGMDIAGICQNEFTANANRAGLPEREAYRGTSLGGGREANYWQSEPEICIMAHGVSNRMDRLKSLGNAVVPQVAEFIGRGIVQVETCLTGR